MERKDFFKAAFFGIAACFLPKILIAEPKRNTSNFKSGGRYVVGVRKRVIGQNTDAEVANLKLQHAIIKLKPQGRCIDMKYLRERLKEVNLEGEQYTIEQLIEIALKQNRKN